MNWKLAFVILTLEFGQVLNSQVTQLPLQNFADASLFNLNDNSCINVSGEWLGEESEFSDPRGQLKGKYTVKFILSQQGNKVTGNSLISFDDGAGYGNMKIRGLVAGNKLYFEEFEVVEQKFVKPGVSWCLRTGVLDIKFGENTITLEGDNYKGYAAYYYFNCQAYVSMSLSKAMQAREMQSAKNDLAAKEQLGMQLHPNPANHEVTVSFNLDQDLPVRVDMYTLAGEHITTIVNDFYTAGKHQHLFSLNTFAAGVYLIRMQAGSQNATAHLVIAR